jgi:hypothetical protein
MKQGLAVKAAMMARSIDASCFAFSTFVVSRKATVRQRSTYVAAPSACADAPDTLTTDTAAHIGGVSAVLEVVSACCRQRSLKLLRPFAVGPGQSLHLVGSQAKIAQYLPERLAGVYGVEELPSYVGGEPLLRPGPAKRS